MASTEDFGGGPAAAAAPAAGPAPDPFEAALKADAAAAAAPESVPAPPRVTPSSDPEAPHGRDELTGEPLAPYGIGKNKRPRIKPAGPGRAGKADQPRVTTGTPATVTRQAGPAGPGQDYREDLHGFATTLWLGGAMVPPARPYAHLLRQSTPGMVEAWNVAAQKNPTVRGYVEKLSGEGSWAWVIGVSVATAPFLLGCWELSRPLKDAKAKAAQEAARAGMAAECEAEFQGYMAEQISLIRAAPAAA